MGHGRRRRIRKRAPHALATGLPDNTLGFVVRHTALLPKGTACQGGASAAWGKDAGVKTDSHVTEVLTPSCLWAEP